MADIRMRFSNVRPSAVWEIWPRLGIVEDGKAIGQHRVRSAREKGGEEDSTSSLRKGVAGDWRNVFTERDRDLQAGRRRSADRARLREGRQLVIRGKPC